MSAAEGLTRGTAWLALVLYVGGEVASRARARTDSGGSLAKWFSTLGCAALLAHIACAFHFHHHWSHAEAYADTARRTGALTGWDWGGGVYVNYLFAAAWLVGLLRLWRVPSSLRIYPPATDGVRRVGGPGLQGEARPLLTSWRRWWARRVEGPGLQVEAGGEGLGGSRETGSEPWLFRAFFLFMFLNGAVIFVPGAAKWFGLTCCLVLVGVWCWPGRKTA